MYHEKEAFDLKTAVLIALLALPLVLSPASAASVNVSVSMDADTYSAASTLTGSAPVATITVTDGEGVGIAGVQVRVVFIRQVQFVGYVGNETVYATTAADGTIAVSAPTLSGAPGNYVVAAYALSAAGSDRYAVGA